MANLPISGLPTITQITSNSIIPIVQDGTTKQITYADFLSSGSVNADSLGGASVRTFYTRNSDIIYTSGSGTNTNFLSGSVQFGSPILPQSFFDNSVNYVAKILHFRAVGKFASGAGNDTNAAIRLQIGDQILSGSNFGTQTLSFSVNKPFEIMGEVIITAGMISTCYAIKYCDQTGDLRAIPLGDVTVSSSIVNFTPGPLQLIISGSTNRTMTSYYAYVQTYN
jgi:hypothetical protein